ncbi:MAG: SAM-dependent DNA methyltransferase [candidate division Zixibacteria bacterium]|nr:SAM-dependent DNA methyltransferase [candidate division Zixibacteria bacterium]
MNQIIREKGLGFEEARMGTSLKMTDETTKFPDGVIWKNKTTGEASLLFEIKNPTWDASNTRLVDIAGKKAYELGTKYFATWNMKDFILWETFRSGVPLYDRHKEWYKNIIWVKDISEVDRKENWEKIKIFLEGFLGALNQDIFRRKKVFVGIPIDQFFIRKLATNVDINSRVFTIALKRKCFEDKDYYARLKKWIWAQGWHPVLKNKAQETDHSVYEKIARIAAYILTNKILFYNVISTEHKDLNPIQTERIKGSINLNKTLRKHFQKVLKINYDTIYKIDIFDDLKVPDDCLEQIVRFIEDFDNYDFRGLNYEILGHVYEDLIPGPDRSEMGQYFTPPSTVDLINSFCIKNPDNVILDLGCGAGTFLVRAYARLKHLKKKKKTHKELLEQLWGVDKSSFPAHLAQINLVLPDLSETENFPYIENKDAFDIKPQETYFEVPFHRGIKHEYKKISPKTAKVKIPEMNAVVGNPPYIRQEKLAQEDKEHISKAVEKDWGNFRLTNQMGLSISRQADIYVYFFIHAARFLKEGGRLGFVTSNSWLDVRYGAGLQKFFLDNFKIIAIIESKVERSFAKADINTAITVLERCSDKRKRDNNPVRFVVLKEKMENLIPKDGDKDRFWACEKLISKITRSRKLYEDSQIKVLPKKQKELYQEGIEDNVYVGSKWGGKYLRAPEIFFKILEKGKDLLVPLKDVAEVRRGFTTGANEFFYLTEEQIKAHMIEKDFLKPLIKSPRESRKILISSKDTKYKVLLVHKNKQQLRKTNVLKYILFGEQKDTHKRPTCSPRQRWYDLGKRGTANILWTEFFFDTHITFLLEDEIYDSDKFYGITIKRYLHETAAFLNSTIAVLLRQLLGFHSLGEGALKIPVYELSSFKVIDFRKVPVSIRNKIKKAFNTISQREILPIFQEIHEKDRQKLDSIFFDILGLTKKERQQVYDAVCELVSNRLKKAKTFGKKNANKKEEFNPSSYADHILEEVFLAQEKKEFPGDFMEPSCGSFTIQLPKIEPRGKLTIEEFFGKASLRIDGETIDCQTTPKANFVELAIEKGVRDEVCVPADDKNCIKAVREYLNYHKIIQMQIEDTMKMFNLTKKQTKAVLSEIENRY